MKYSGLSILFLFLFLGLFASENNLVKSSHQLTWHGVANYENRKSLSFDDSKSLDQSGLPYFGENIALQNTQELDSLSLKNIVLGDFTDEEKAFINSSSITIGDSAILKINYATAQKEKKAVLSFLPIVIKNGVLKKIVSFDLVYLLKTPLSFRSAKTTGLHQYASHSVLQSGKWVKISVSKTGIYKITYEDLVNWGISDPANARVFGYGGAMLPEDFSKTKEDDLPQLSVWKEKGSDGVFNAGDYILFYAQGAVSWNYSTAKLEFTRTINPYSFLGYYFITSDVGSEKVIAANAANNSTPTVSVTTFLDYQVYEKETENLLSSGKDWYGEVFSTTSSYSFPFSFENIDTGKNMKVEVDAAASVASTMSVFLDNSSLGSLSFSSPTTYDKGTKATSIYSVLPTESSFNIKLTYNNASSGTAWLNYITVNAYRQLSMTGSSMFFRNPSVIGSSQVAQYTLSGSSGLVVWDMTDPCNITQVSCNYSANQYTFTDSATQLKEYVALNPSGSFLSPTYVGVVGNQDLHAISQVDFVIIANSNYVSQAQTLANKHIKNDGISALVVTPEQIYNEFSSGTPDATAYRWLMKMFYDRAQSTTDAPKNLLLFGDGTYDNRSILSVNSSVNKLLTYQSDLSLNELDSYVDDDYFGLLDDNEGTNVNTGLLDIGVGRFPVSTSTQASNVVSKITTYMDNDQKGYWKNRLAYIADDDNDTEFTFQSDTLVRNIEKNFKSYQPKRFFLDSYTQETSASGESYPLAKEKFFDLFNSGLLLVNYMGHGSIEGLANEKIISRSDIADMYNKKLPFFVTATCNFSKFDDATSSSGEDILLNPNGGAVGLFSTTRTVLLDGNFPLNKYFNNHVLETENGKPLDLGKVMLLAKNEQCGVSNRLSFILLGDPALKLNLPLNKVSTTAITSTSNVVSDTIQALSVVTVKGQIQTSDGNLLSQFNGTLTAAVYDKIDSITTQANQSDVTYTYADRPNMLFFGKTPVVNGVFTLTFMVPKDIAYNYGKGRINFYAADTTNDLEANGYNESFTIGGSKSDFVSESNGPAITMYINSPEFKSGDAVDATPVFFATLSDENGINTTGNGIGHDLLLTLNSDPTLSYVLNDYYESNLGDYKSGSLVYEIPTLDDGSYTLSFRAWDLLDNSSTKSLTFKVQKGIEPELYEIYAMPNPAQSYVRFILRHNQPQSKMKVTVEVYNIAGQKLWSASETSYAEENTTEFDWNLTTQSGQKLPQGMYLYRMFVESEEESALVSKTNKLIVK